LKILGFLLCALAGQTMAADAWPSRDADLGRIYSVPGSPDAYVLVSHVHAYAAPLDEWFGPRVDALAGEGVTAERAGVERLPDGSLRAKLKLRGESVPATDVVVTAYATPAGNQMLVSIGGSVEAEQYVGEHLAKQDVWVVEGWQTATPLPPMDNAGLECRMEQQPSVVWVIDRMCEVDCALEPGSAMVLIDAEVCREPR